MKDPEIIELRNKVLIVLLIVVIFSIPIYFIFKNKIFNDNSKIIKAIKNNDRIAILVTENRCSRCNKVKDILNDNDAKYYILNKDKDSNYKKIIKKLDIIEEDIVTPAIIYVEKGKAITTYVDINSKSELKKFIKNYKLSE